MQIINFRYKLHLFWLQALILVSVSVYAQNYGNTYLLGYDQKKVHYGFTLGTHTSAFILDYNNAYTSFDTLHSVMQPRSVGVNVGMLVNFRLTELLDIRTLLKVGFYEHLLRYNFTNGSFQNELIESTFVEMPLLLKLKSIRRDNSRVYIVGGITPGINARGLDEGGGDADRLPVKRFNLMLEAGMGLDFYFPLFKFSPEIRFSRGIIDVLTTPSNNFSAPIRRLSTNAVSLYFHFE